MARKSLATTADFDPEAAEPTTAETTAEPTTAEETDYRIHSTIRYWADRNDFKKPAIRLGLLVPAASVANRIVPSADYETAVKSLTDAFSALFPLGLLSAEAHTVSGGITLTLAVSVKTLRANGEPASDYLKFDAITAVSLVKAVSTAAHYCRIMARPTTADSTIYPDPAVSAKYLGFCQTVRSRLGLTTARISAYLSAEPSAEPTTADFDPTAS